MTFLTNYFLDAGRGRPELFAQYPLIFFPIDAQAHAVAVKNLGPAHEADDLPHATGVKFEGDALMMFTHENYWLTATIDTNE